MKREKDEERVVVTADRKRDTLAHFPSSHTHTQTHKSYHHFYQECHLLWAFKKGGAAASGRRGIEEDISSN